MVTRVLATGLAMGESPRWHDGRLWLCDWLAGEVLTVDADARTEVVRRIGGLPFSVDWLPDGREVYTTNRGVVVGPDLMPYGGTGRPWNEIVVDTAGRVYVDMPGSSTMPRCAVDVSRSVPVRPATLTAGVDPCRVVPTAVLAGSSHGTLRAGQNLPSAISESSRTRGRRPRAVASTTIQDRSWSRTIAKRPATKAATAHAQIPTPHTSCGQLSV